MREEDERMFMIICEKELKEQIKKESWSFHGAKRIIRKKNIKIFEGKT